MQFFVKQPLIACLKNYWIIQDYFPHADSDDEEEEDDDAKTAFKPQVILEPKVCELFSNHHVFWIWCQSAT